MATVLVATITAVVGPLLLAWFTRSQLAKRVGTPNGQGTAVELLERLVAGQAGQDKRLARLEERVGSCESELAGIKRCLDVPADKPGPK